MKHHLLSALIASGLVSTACVDERTDVDDPPGPAASEAARDEGEGGGGGAEPDPGGCEPGAIEECLIDLGTQNGKKTCLPGERRCDAEGVWGRCRRNLGNGQDG